MLLQLHHRDYCVSVESNAMAPERHCRRIYVFPRSTARDVLVHLSWVWSLSPDRYRTVDPRDWLAAARVFAICSCMLSTLAAAGPSQADLWHGIQEIFCEAWDRLPQSDLVIKSTRSNAYGMVTLVPKTYLGTKDQFSHGQPPIRLGDRCEQSGHAALFPIPPSQRSDESFRRPKFENSGRPWSWAMTL
ncbi:hypothetical protein M406DRAFT_327324 [Cryphonectria parasitica EP155]|uniref:Uncharacterized protein n=1 Tax=Cryphonectria parasitica (strain ATCC 38755 / EP155) TaxID=660469 RepID=A0A9P4Y9P4_CRYP1|nr:uncharacterized protein M406DRAFT_327324 [Cryphonectria parasitica EP155]KAF3768912.1 hypothetical protein M406DRAFT_327324 [Cryphonectria parasitica EP155]